MPPGLVVAAQLMTISIAYIEFIFQTGIFSNQIQVLTVVALPGAIRAEARALEVCAAAAIGGIAIVIGQCYTSQPAVTQLSVVAT